MYFTPLKSNTELDAELIRMLIEKEYQTAGIKPSDVETGAVIITGDTARKTNADKVLSSISEFAGDFVVATAGPRLESILAGKGSGAQSVCHSDEKADGDGLQGADCRRQRKWVSSPVQDSREYRRQADHRGFSQRSGYVVQHERGEN